mmetsp:Transcript_60241/g.161646  ORF Transcript_60241/g.161646 Transcript_60241/m.161646 type:complete len:297 (+) Transcript_60241:33-923(+)
MAQQEQGNDDERTRQLERLVLQLCPGLEDFPLVSPVASISLEKRVDELLEDASFSDDFAWTTSLHPRWVAEQMNQGFLPTAEMLCGQFFIGLPKLHVHRSVLRWENFHIEKNARKRSKKLQMSVNKSFDEVMVELLRTHGEHTTWLQPPLNEAFRVLSRAAGSGEYCAQVISIEVWDSDGKLVAGEIGYVVRRVYCSLSGFCHLTGAGTVQMCCLGKMLQRRGCAFWDLGMHLPYKGKLGAVRLPRAEFVTALRQSGSGLEVSLEGRVPCSELLSDKDDDAPTGPLPAKIPKLAEQ